MLLGLTANLFDAVPIEKMTDAERAVRQAAAHIPAAVADRFETAPKLTDADRKTVTDLARAALVPFLPAPPAEKP